MDEEMVQAIKDRKLVPHKYISVAKMLELNGMSEYESICCKRILGYADDRHIILDVFGVDVLLDEVGIIACEDVLKGYISSKTLLDYQTYTKATNGVIKSQNTQIKTMRDCQTKTIKIALENPAQYFNGNEELTKTFVEMLQLELKARKPYNKLRVLIKKIIDRAVFYIKNYRAISVVNRCFREISQE